MTTEPFSGGEVFSAEDLEHFETQGYVTLPGAVPAEQVSAAAGAIWQFLGMDPTKPDDWYRPPHSPDGLVEIYQHQAFWDNRQTPRIYAAFCQLWKTRKLWVSLDRASMKPPVNPKYPAWEHPPFLHWDVDLKECPIEFGLQGVLCLSDSTADHGGFHCIPGMHRDTIEWSRAPLGERDVNVPPPLDGQKVETIAAKAGDLIIWHRALPHGSGINRSDRPRLAQFILCAPAGFAVSGPHAIDDAKSELYEKLRWQRIGQWERRIATSALGLDARELGPPARLTPLGRRLLGLDLWE